MLKTKKIRILVDYLVENIDNKLEIIELTPKKVEDSFNSCLLKARKLGHLHEVIKFCRIVKCPKYYKLYCIVKFTPIEDQTEFYIIIST